MRKFPLIASSYGIIGVALGAFGAHGLEARLQANDRIETWETATLYLFVHVLVLLIVPLWNDRKPDSCFTVAGWCFVIGVFVFSGSLYVLSLSNITKLGMIAPIGGVSFLVGWGALLKGFLKK